MRNVAALVSRLAGVVSAQKAVPFTPGAALLLIAPPVENVTRHGPDTKLSDGSILRAYEVEAPGLDGDRVPLLVSFKTRPGRTFVNGIGIQFGRARWTNSAAYALGLVPFVLEEVCLGAPDRVRLDSNVFQAQSVGKIGNNGTGRFEKSFRGLTMRVSGSYYTQDGTMELTIDLLAAGSPGAKGWTLYCTLDE
ncbi:MAG TPA: hypothetical protein VHN99_01440 [Deinococcales bacterium]|nr:hypothetical protein [Deinococcales bacterium]